MSRHSLSTSSSESKAVFLVKLLVAVLLLLGYIHAVLPQYSGSYNAALIDKVERLESIREPKIVLLGTSTLPFGIRSEMIEGAMGMPTVNMGLHAALGNAFHEEMAKYNICPGDIYVLSDPEYSSDVMYDPAAAWITIENHYHLWRLIRLKDIPAMFEAFPVYLKKSLTLYAEGTGNLDPGDFYSRSAFNEYGDIGTPRYGTHYFPQSAAVPGVSAEAADRINRLNRYITSRGASLVVAGYPIANGSYTSDPKDYAAFGEKLQAALECPVISNFEDYMMDDKYFYNTNYHLNSDGASLYTAQVIADLQRWQEAAGDAPADSGTREIRMSDVRLAHLTDAEAYLDALIAAKDRYTVLIAAKDEASSSLNDALLSRLRQLGLSGSLAGSVRCSYIAVSEKGRALYEEAAYRQLQREDILDDGKLSFTVVSGGYDCGNTCAVVINGTQYAPNARGLNIVVYSNESHRVLDQVVFDTYLPDAPASR